MNQNKQRLDVIVRRHPAGWSPSGVKLSRASIKKAIENGGVFVNGKVERDAGKKIIESAEVKLDEKMFNKIVDSGTANTVLQADDEISEKIKVVYEDDDIAIIEKPAGLVVHVDNLHKEKTLSNGLIAKWPEIISVGDDPSRPGIVHRLDKDVSGVMVIAKTQRGFDHLKKQFKNREITKKYIAVVHGTPLSVEGRIEGRIKRSKYNPTKQMISDDETGKEAITKYKVLEKKIINDKEMSLLEVQTFTGRMHQIRVHLASIGCPIVGDKKYLPSEMAKADKSDRIMLHAELLRIKMLGGGEREFTINYQFAMINDQ
ncbi:RluA family pseudouridine synthase [bacterium]|nr:MAG: RluA family pseudouridine synthase [bacterium]